MVKASVNLKSKETNYDYDFPLVQRIKILIGCSASILSSGTLEGRLHVDIILTNVLSLSLARFPCLTRVMFHQNLRHSYLN